MPDWSADPFLRELGEMNLASQARSQGQSGRGIPCCYCTARRQPGTKCAAPRRHFFKHFCAREQNSKEWNPFRILNSTFYLLNSSPRRCVHDFSVFEDMDAAGLLGDGDDGSAFELV